MTKQKLLSGLALVFKEKLQTQTLWERDTVYSLFKESIGEIILINSDLTYTDLMKEEEDSTNDNE